MDARGWRRPAVLDGQPLLRLNRRLRHDAYTPGGVIPPPDYAVTVYCNLIRQTYPHVPVVIGGIEASLRRLAHYDYWSDALKPRSILAESQADLLLYGMGERSIVEVGGGAQRRHGHPADDVTYIDGTVFASREPDPNLPTIRLPSYEECYGRTPKICRELLSAVLQHRPVFGEAAAGAVR